ncbi:MAG TPA: GNAT family N-acetyltransferase [Gaiellaceae bacterium]|nr:GNAT family N-acetyltransferase [Gaiellaceae bacterium]
MIALAPLSAERARRIVAGEFDGLDHVEGWPHEDTRDGLRLAEGGARVWLVEDDGVVIGDCGTTGPLDREVEIGFGLAAECRGRGHGTEVVRLLTEALCAEPDVERIVAHTLTGNVASQRVLEKAGFALDSVRNGTAGYARRAD